MSRLVHMVIFDCDGVLIDSEPATQQIMAADLAQHGLPISAKDCATLFVGGTMASAMQEATRRGATLPADWVDQINAQVAARLAQGVPLLPGLLPLLGQIEAAGLATAIASNGPQSKMRASLGPSGLWDRFAGRIHSAHDEGHPKPAPDMLLKAAQQAGVAPEATVMIDDNPSGLQAARAAGMRAIGLAADGNSARLRPDADEVISHLGQLPPLIGL